MIAAPAPACSGARSVTAALTEDQQAEQDEDGHDQDCGQDQLRTGVGKKLTDLLLPIEQLGAIHRGGGHQVQGAEYLPS